MSGAPSNRQLTLRVDWSEADNFPTFAANIFLIQQSGQEFFITLGTALPPIFETPPTQEELAEIRTIKARPIARIALAPGRIVELIQNLQQQLNAYQATLPH